MKKLLYVLIIMLVIVLVGLQFLLPPMLNQKVLDGINNTLNPASSQVVITSIPAAKLLIGKVDEIEADVTEAKLKDGLVFKSIHLVAQDVGFNVASLYSGKEFILDTVGSGKLEGVLTEDEINAYLAQKLDKMVDPEIRITPDEVALQGRVSIGGFLEGTVTATGTIEVKGNTIIFAPRRMSLNGTNLPSITSAILKEVPIYNFDNFPFPVSAKEVEAQKGSLHVTVVPISK